tara:strand:- start:3435 stop:4208 length:774 start_codon:yes stop_codon:yes gene_type:complete
MNISKQKKAETREKLVQAAIDLFTEQGFEKTTMKAIARRAEVGDATIYKYFSSKDKLVLAFYQLRAAQTIQKLAEIDTQDYDLHEQLQLLIDLYLESLLPDREFVVGSAKKILAAQSFMISETPTIRQEFNGVINQFLDQAEGCDEIPYFHYRSMMVGIINEYLMGVLLYWLKDNSDEFSDTTQMVDLSLTLGVQLLRSGIPNKINDLMSFFIKRHLFNLVGSGGGIMEILKGVMTNKGASGMFDQWQPENKKSEAE